MQRGSAKIKALKNWLDETSVDEIGVDEMAVDETGVDEPGIIRTKYNFLGYFTLSNSVT